MPRRTWLAVAAFCLIAWPARAQTPFQDQLLAETIAAIQKGRPARVAQHDWDEARALAFIAIGESRDGGRAAIPLLSASLSDRNPHVATAAAVALVKLEATTERARALKTIDAALAGGARDAFDAARMGLTTLTRIPRDVEPIVLRAIARPGGDRASFVTALAHLPADRIEATVPVLTALLRDGDRGVPTAAVDTLAGFGVQARAAVPALRELLSSPDRWTRTRTALALLRIESPPDAALARVLAQAIKESVDAAPRGFDRLREEAVDGLATLVHRLDDTVLPALLALVDQPDELAARKAIELLGKLGPRAVASLPALERARAARSGGGWMTDDLDRAIRRVRGEEPTSDVYVTHTDLTAIDVAPAIRDLASGDLATRRQALWAIHDGAKSASARAAVPALLPLLGDPDPDTRFVAAAALATIDRTRVDAALPVLEEMLRSDARIDRVAPPLLGARTLGLLGQVGAEALVRAVDDTNVGARTAAIHELASSEVFPPSAIDALLRASDAPAAAIRRDALITLYYRQVAATTLVPRLLRALTDPDAPVRYAATCGLAHVAANGRPIVAALHRAAQDADAVVRFGAMAAIAAVDRREALRYLPILSAELERTPIPGVDVRDRSSRLASTALALGALGPDARSALPALIRAWERNEGTERDDLGVAMARIDAQAGAPVVQEYVDVLGRADSFFQPETLRQLERMGPAAVLAIPAITRLLDSPDDAVRDAAKAALAAIRSPAGR